MTQTLDGKVALVTGGSRGIGRAIARQLAAVGASVAITYRTRAADAEGVVADIRALGGTGICIQSDVCSTEAVESMAHQVEAELAQVDILVNNAGIARDGLLMRMSEADWQEVLQTNLTGAFRCTRAVLRKMMRRRWGRIINMSSVGGQWGGTLAVPYAVSKTALIGLTRSLAKLSASSGVTVNAIAPGLVETDIISGERGTEAFRQKVSAIPVGRTALPDEVAHTALFLAGDGSAYVTGQTLNVNGGMYFG